MHWRGFSPLLPSTHSSRAASRPHVEGGEVLRLALQRPVQGTNVDTRDAEGGVADDTNGYPFRPLELLQDVVEGDAGSGRCCGSRYQPTTTPHVRSRCWPGPVGVGVYRGDLGDMSAERLPESAKIPRR